MEIKHKIVVLSFKILGVKQQTRGYPNRHIKYCNFQQMQGEFE